MTKTDKWPTIVLWCGRRLDELSREELIEALQLCANDLEDLRKDRDKWARHGDVVSYLLDGA